jgi:hypothetical protein
LVKARFRCRIEHVEAARAIDALLRQRATVDLDIRDVKEGAGLEHVPSEKFHANGARLFCAVLATTSSVAPTGATRFTPLEPRANRLAHHPSSALANGRRRTGPHDPDRWTDS